MPPTSAAPAADQTTARASQPVWFNLARAAIELGAGAYCIVQQFNTTRNAIFGLLQAGVQIPAQMTAQQLLQFLNSNADKLNSIAFTVALITQVVFWWAALPKTKKGHHPKLRQGIAIALFVLEIFSDIWYAASAQTTINGSLVNVFFGGGFAWVAVLLFAVCTSFGSTFVFLNGVRVLGNVLEGNPD